MAINHALIDQYFELLAAGPSYEHLSHDEIAELFIELCDAQGIAADLPNDPIPN